MYKKKFEKSKESFYESNGCIIKFCPCINLYVQTGAVGSICMNAFVCFYDLNETIVYK